MVTTTIEKVQAALIHIHATLAHPLPRYHRHRQDQRHEDEHDEGCPHPYSWKPGGGGHLSGARWFSRGSPTKRRMEREGRGGSRDESAMKQPQDLAFYIYSDLNPAFQEEIC